MADDVKLPPLPAKPAARVNDPASPGAGRRFSNNSSSAWPTDSDYARPSPQYLSEQTKGPLSDERSVTAQTQGRFNREYAKGSREINVAEARRQKRISKPFSLRGKR